MKAWFHDPDIMLKTQRIRASPSCSSQRPVFGLWWMKALKRQTVKIPRDVPFSLAFLILCIQVWFDNPNNMLKTQRKMASPSYSTERPTFGSWWIKTLKPSDGKISTIMMLIILLTFYSRYFASKFGFIILTSS